MKEEYFEKIRRFLTCFLLVTNLFATAQTSSSKRISVEDLSKVEFSFKPNILWLVCEDQSMFFSFCGDSTAMTPNLDRLANEGVVFDQAYATSPVCSPARSGIITGMHPVSLGTHNMRTFNPWKKSEKFQHDTIPIYSPVLPKGVTGYTEFVREAGYYCTNNDKEDYNFSPPNCFWDASNHSADWRNRKKGQPFFSIINYFVTHESRLWKNAKLGVTVDPRVVPVPEYFPDDSIVRQDIAINYSNIERLDKQVGEAMDRLEKDGLLDSTIVIFYSDHGGPFPRHKRSIHHSGLQVPFIIRFPEKLLAGTRSDDFISFLDLAPTVLSVAGAKSPKYLQGNPIFGKGVKVKDGLFAATDRFDECPDKRRTWFDKKFKIVKNYHSQISRAIPVSYRENIPMMRRMMELNKENKLNEKQKIWFSAQKPEWEFYDLKKDPNELRNLGTSHPLFKKYKKQLLKSIKKYDVYTDVSESQMVKQMWPNGTAPKVEDISWSVKKGQLKLKCRTPGSRICYKMKGDPSWTSYKGAVKVKPGEKIDLQAYRIGYEFFEQEITIPSP